MRIYVWGTGPASNIVLNNYVTIDNISGFIDNDETVKTHLNKNVYKPDFLLSIEFDCVIIATSHTQEVYLQCIELGIELSKCVFIFNNYLLEDLNKNYTYIRKILGVDAAEKIKNDFKLSKAKHHIIPNSYNFNDDFSKQLISLKSDINHYETDYVRIKTFEMILHEMSDVEGAVAELGVFRGDFAQYLNLAFPDRKLYLFDSFDGFDESEAQNEKDNNICNDIFINAFKRTRLDIVINKMPYINNVVIKKGYFPKSLNGLEEKFSFVSLDVDFEDTTLEGLRYFYPRLNEGGYIFIHDYNCKDEVLFSDVDLRTSIHNAVRRYENEIGCRLHKVPICDMYGTLIISK